MLLRIRVPQPHLAPRLPRQVFLHPGPAQQLVEGRLDPFEHAAPILSRRRLERHGVHDPGQVRPLHRALPAYRRPWRQLACVFACASPHVLFHLIPLLANAVRIRNYNAVVPLDWLTRAGVLFFWDLVHARQLRVFVRPIPGVVGELGTVTKHGDARFVPVDHRPRHLHVVLESGDERRNRVRVPHKHQQVVS